MQRSADDEKKAFAIKEAAQKRETFEAWLTNPIVAMGVSLIPDNKEHPGAVKAVLRAAFDAGFSAGYGFMAGEVFERIGFPPKKPEQPR